MWGRLSLRWQVALAVLVPSLVISVLGAGLFPPRQKAIGMERLKERAFSVALLARQEVARLLTESPEGGADRFQPLFEQVDQGGRVAFQAVVEPNGAVLSHRGTVPSGIRTLKAATGCIDGRVAEAVVVRCALADGRSYVLGYDTAVVHEDTRAFVLLALPLFLVSTVIGLGLAFLLSRAISEPVSHMTDMAREVSMGDVSRSSLEVSAAGEVRLMAHSFNEMLGTLRATVAELVSRTEQLSSASRGLTGASADQEHVISQQAAYAQQIAATFEELSRTAEQISSSTEVVESSARRTHEAVAEAMAVVAQVVAGINDIRIESKGVADAIVGLNQDLQQVSKIAQVINQVAERSDLLALNAALEGTKAGEVGRGFSLVAAEMRKLAENVSGSARDIARIVEKVQDSGDEAAAKARVGMATSDRGVEVAEQASAVFERIVELARGTSEAARQITIATRQQRQSSEQAVQGARNVAELVKQGVDATGRTTRIAQDLQAVAEGLTAVTGRFKVARD
ncbi:methyl-accepting chemotaxis protein [Stigmatella sp. ncwal1]|uniref:Methyl-accepting chemotaxis protein n=1 Tax=Stigmatella ashevillensis TaxID=2995309 RepID=A0ABT5DR37_9BACT|nr:methyl-accepting chemotaxis protein [Stigmatella ashevillena]MDC0715173.1 methyl-accepting chemotaxis protein [Stigmatella ashevillena]